MICLLGSSLLAVLAAAGWWRVTWPERTARQIVELVQAGNYKEAKEMIAVPVMREATDFNLEFVKPDRMPTPSVPAEQEAGEP